MSVHGSHSQHRFPTPSSKGGCRKPVCVRACVRACVRVCVCKPVLGVCVQLFITCAIVIFAMFV